MKKLLTVLVMALALTACSGSGVSQEEYNKVVKENAELKEQIEEASNGSGDDYASLKALAEQYAAEADRDAYWIGYLFGEFAKLVQSSSPEIAEAMYTSQSELAVNKTTYNSELIMAAASMDKDRIEALHDNWIETTSGMTDSMSNVFGVIGEIVNSR